MNDACSNLFRCSNLFDFAPRELSHSAYWAWVIQCLDQNSPKDLIPVRPLANLLLERFGVVNVPSNLTVKTEHPLKPNKTKFGRADIHAAWDNTQLVIETKIAAGFGTNQLNRYKEFLDKSPEHGLLGVISTAFDTSELLRTFPGTAPLVFLDMQLELTRPYREAHWLVRQHCDWLEAEQNKRRKLERLVDSDDYNSIKEVMKEPYVQWYLMGRLTETFEGIQYRGTNIGGLPWTQFRFAGVLPKHESNSKFDSVFYRIDRYSSGYYLSLRQYQKDPKDVNAKKDRLEWLRAAWANAMAGVGVQPTSSKMRKPGKRANEYEIVGYPLAENSLPALKDALRHAHPRFVTVLKNERNWPLASSWSIKPR